MELQDLKKHLDDRLDRIEDKLDDSRQRIAAAETSIVWIRGNVKLMYSLLAAAVSGVIAAGFHLLTGK